MRYLVCLFSVSCLVLSGCTLATTAPVGEMESPAFEGSLMGGQQPIGGATISVYQVGTSGYGQGATLMASTTSSSTGSFSFATSAYTCTSANAPMYLTATGGDAGSGTNANIVQMALLGPCTAARSAWVIMNEISTAASVIAMAPYMNTTMGASVTPEIGATCTSCAAGVFNQGLVNAMTNTYPMLYVNSNAARGRRLRAAR